MILAGILACTSVSAKAPPGHGVVKESKSNDVHLVNDLHTGGALLIQLHAEAGVMLHIEEPRTGAYAPAPKSLYKAPVVRPVAAFYERSSC